MCGRYVSPDEASIEREFNLVRTEWQFPANFNTAPSQAVPAVRAREGGREGVLLRWGLVPYFAKGKPGKYATFNARSETLDSSASFQWPWKRGQRCIIPALGFYEWHVNPDGGKQPFYIHLDDQAIFGFAGLWERSRADAGSVIESCTIITLPANALMAGVHNSKARMPAILSRELRETWLFGSAEAAAAALAAYPDDRMIAYPVDARVNSPRNNDETLLDPQQTEVD
ncbi:MAG: SOS response-associated peptidase [Steroidobacteraceae bacterium]